MGITNRNLGFHRIVRCAVPLLAAAVIALTLMAPAACQADAGGGRRPVVGSPFGIAAGFLYGYEGVGTYPFMRHVRGLGAGFTKLYLFWNQVEPEKGRFDWTAVDAFLSELQSPDEALVSVFSASMWATERATTLLPPSPAKDLDDYYRFIHALVTHCKGRVRYWQNDAEPNSPIYWSGSKEEYVAALEVFYKAVKHADPDALVVVGGYDGLFTPPGAPGYPYPDQQKGLDFFEYVIKEGRDVFDVFDLRLYAHPNTIPHRVEYMRGRLRASGRDKPIFSTEYGGPNFYEFRTNREQYLPLVASWLKATAAGGSVPLGPGNPIAELYDKRQTLAPETQMFLQDAPPELEAKYQRIQARSLVMRNVLALSAGVQKMIYWYLPLMPLQGANRFNLMALMYGKIGLLQLEGDRVVKRTPSADAFERMARTLHGVQQITRVELPAAPDIYFFRAERGQRGPAFVVWDPRDQFSGEDAPALPVTLPWIHDTPRALDALGGTLEVTLEGKRLTLPVSVTPIFLEPDR
jgi:hypothetical protein